MRAMRNRLFMTAAALCGTLFLAPAAQARGIDCAKAASRLEKMTCADPVMLEYDARIAAAYARALAQWKGAIVPYVRCDQAAWLQRFRAAETVGEAEGGCAIDDRDCIREDMRARVDAIESGAYVHGGIYLAPDGRKLILTPRTANGYALRVFRPSGLPEYHVTSLDEDRAALWDGPDFMVAKMGDGNGLPLPNPLDGPDPDGCTLRLAPAALSIQVWQMGACGGRDYAGTYKRDLAQTLADYELELH